MKSLIKLALKIRGSLNQVADYNFISPKGVGVSIPKVIHQIYHTKTPPTELLENINYLQSLNPDWEYRIYDFEDAEKYIAKHYPELLGIYNKINPTYLAARADFLRYLIIYNEGGVYLDIKSTLTKPLSDVISKDDSYLLSHWQNEPGQPHHKIGFHGCISNTYGEYQQWHVAAVKGHPFLKAVIENVCNNIKHYNPFIHDTGGWSVVNVTGPIAYSLAIEPLVNSHQHRLERDNTKFGFVYSIFELKGIGLGHHKFLKKHYTLSDESLITLPLATKLAFNISKPFIKLLKSTLIKMR